MKEDKIFQKLKQHDKRFDKIDKRFIEIDKRFDAHDKRFDAHDKHFDFLIKKVLEHDEKFVTKDEFTKFREEVLDGQDKMMVILKRLDQERIFTLEWIRKIEKRVESQALEIAKIKKVLKLA